MYQELLVNLNRVVQPDKQALQVYQEGREAEANESLGEGGLEIRQQG